MRLCVLFCVLESTWRITNWRILTFEEERRFHVCCLPPLAYSTQTTELNAKIGQRLNQVSSHIIKDTRRYKIPNLMFLCIQPFFSSSYFLRGGGEGFVQILCSSNTRILNYSDDDYCSFCHLVWEKNIVHITRILFANIIYIKLEICTQVEYSLLYP